MEPEAEKLAQPVLDWAAVGPATGSSQRHADLPTPTSQRLGGSADAASRHNSPRVPWVALHALPGPRWHATRVLGGLRIAHGLLSRPKWRHCVGFALEQCRRGIGVE